VQEAVAATARRRPAVAGEALCGRGVNTVREISLALAIYGLAVWIYVGLCALTTPDTLALPLTHLLPSLREDTSGAFGLIVPFLGFISYRTGRRD
jgi:hypothetical protein